MTNQEIEIRIEEIEREIAELERERDELERELDHNNGDDIIIGDCKYGN